METQKRNWQFGDRFRVVGSLPQNRTDYQDGLEGKILKEDVDEYGDECYIVRFDSRDYRERWYDRGDMEYIPPRSYDKDRINCATAGLVLESNLPIASCGTNGIVDAKHICGGKKYTLKIKQLPQRKKYTAPDVSTLGWDDYNNCLTSWSW